MPLSDARAAGVRGQSQAMRDGEDCARDPGLRGCRAGTFDDARHLRARAHATVWRRGRTRAVQVRGVDSRRREPRGQAATRPNVAKSDCHRPRWTANCFDWSSRRSPGRREARPVSLAPVCIASPRLGSMRRRRATAVISGSAPSCPPSLPSLRSPSFPCPAHARHAAHAGSTLKVPPRPRRRSRAETGCRGASPSPASAARRTSVPRDPSPAESIPDTQTTSSPRPSRYATWTRQARSLYHPPGSSSDGRVRPGFKASAKTLADSPTRAQAQVKPPRLVAALRGTASLAPVGQAAEPRPGLHAAVPPRARRAAATLADRFTHAANHSRHAEDPRATRR